MEPSPKGSSRTAGHSRGLTRALLLLAGSLALALAIIGVAVPVLPTTPFLIVAAICFARSSEKAHRWLLTNRMFGRHLCDYMEGRGLCWTTRLRALALLWIVITASALLVADPLPIRTLLFAIAGFVTVHVATLPGPSRSRVRRDGRALGLAVSAFTYVLALGVAWGVVASLDLAHPLAQIGLGTFVATLVVFGCSMLVDNSSMYDPYWSVQPLAIAVYYLVAAGSGPSLRQVVVAVLVFLYALRLTSNFYRDWPGLSHEDFRYREFRRRFGRLYWPVSLMGIHLFPTLMVYLGCLPLYAVMTVDGAAFGWLDVLGIVVTLGAVVLAFVADEQMRAFRRESANRGKSIGSGLWAVSRHPNYLGEIATWWGLLLFGLAAGLEWWWTALGALAITLMFVFVSVPMMERRALATRSGYREYRAATPMLLPGLRRSAAVSDEAGVRGGE